jgi:drug/metabolite transporter (DMT)-like permease
MLVKYKKQANIAAGVWLVTLVALLAVFPSTKGNIWESGDVLGMVLVSTSIGAFWFSFWAYAKAKGYSGFLGLVLPLLSVLGLIILAVLRDKHPESASDVGTTKLASNKPTLDEKLQELKRLNDSGLISQEVYLERQRKLLEAS